MKLNSKRYKRKTNIAIDGLTDFLLNSIIGSLLYLFCILVMNDAKIYDKYILLYYIYVLILYIIEVKYFSHFQIREL